MGVIVGHTTESGFGTARGVADYLIAKGFEPHEVYDPSNDECIALLPDNLPGRALENDAGGVETNNRGGVYQIEIVGRAAEVPTYDDAWYARLAAHLRAVCARLGVPYVFPCPFIAYPDSYGQDRPQRLTGQAWLTIEGIIGHQHVPENSHGDPGALDVARLTKDDDMPTPEEIAKAVWGEPLAIEGQSFPAGQWLGFVYAQLTRPDLLQKRIVDAIDATLEVDLTDTETVALAKAIVAELRALLVR